MDKRAIIGIALSILVLVIYQDLVTRFYGPPPRSTPPAIENKSATRKTRSRRRRAPAAPAAGRRAAALPATPRRKPAQGR